MSTHNFNTDRSIDRPTDESEYEDTGDHWVIDGEWIVLNGPESEEWFAVHCESAKDVGVHQ